MLIYPKKRYIFYFEPKWADILSCPVCCFPLEQAKEDQGEVQGPGWRGQRADDAAARGEGEQKPQINRCRSTQSLTLTQ